jgi:hypothetical protein
LAQDIGRGLGAGDLVLAVPRDQHAKLRAPVADVILANDLVAKETQHAGEDVADNRCAQMADVHLFGNVG